MIKFGLNLVDVDCAAEVIGRILKVEFRPHESSFCGGAYCRAETSEGTIFIQPNLDLIDDKPFEANWPSDGSLLYFDGLDDALWAPYIDAIGSDQSLRVTKL